MIQKACDISGQSLAEKLVITVYLSRKAGKMDRPEKESKSE